MKLMAIAILLMLAGGGTAAQAQPAKRGEPSASATEEREEREEGEEGEEREEREERSHSRRAQARSRGVLPWLVASSAVVLYGGALGFGLEGGSLYEQAKTEPNRQLREGAWQAANKNRHVSLALGAAGTVCTGVAVWMFHRAEMQQRDRARHVQLAPTTDGEQVGLTLSGEY